MDRKQRGLPPNFPELVERAKAAGARPPKVRHPPPFRDAIRDRGWKAAICIAPDPTDPGAYEAHKALFACEHAFEQTGNPLHALRAFRVATDAGLFPPMWVIEFLQSRFQRFEEVGSLDRAFGLSRQGAGKGNWTSPEEQLTLQRRNYALAVNVFKLEALELSRAEACRAVASLFFSTADGESMGEAGVRKAIESAEDGLAAEREAARRGAQTWTEEDKRQLLRMFDPLTLTRKTRERFGL